MAIYKKGSDLGPLVKAAEQQKSERAAVRKQPGGEEVIRQAGLNPISNGMIKPSGEAYRVDYSKKERPIVSLENQPVSGGVVAARAEYVKKSEKITPSDKEKMLRPVKKIGAQSAGPKYSSGVIKKRVLQDKSAPNPKKKAANQSDVKKALKGGNITAEEAADLSPKFMTPSVKVK